MTAPTDSTLDPRFSDPGATATTWEQTRHALESAQLFWISTVRSDGRPHTAPLVAVWLDDSLYFCTGAEEQKAINVSQNPRLTLMTGCNTWNQGLDLVVEGDAARVTEQPMLERLAQEWATKWDGRWRFQVGDEVFEQEGGRALVFRVRPSKVLAFGKGPFSQTRHIFS